MPFLHILLLGFSSAVIAVWYKHHFVMLPDNQFSISLPFSVSCSVAALCFFFLFRHFKRNPQFQFSWRPIMVVPIVFVFSALIFNTQAFLRGILLADGPLIPFVHWFTANLSFMTKFGTILLTYCLLTIAFYSAGGFLLRLFRQPLEPPMNESLYADILRILLGMLVWSIFLLGLGYFKALTATPIWTAGVLLCLSEYAGLIALFRKLITASLFQPNWKSSSLSLLALCSFLVAFTMTQSLRPHPTGYDDMTFYMDRVHLVSNEHALISGGRPYPFELIAAAIRIASGDETLFLAMSLATYALFLGALIVYGFGKDFFNHRTGLLAAAILLSLPIGAALAFREVKPDSLLFVITTFVFWSLIKSITQKEIHYWYAAVTLFAFAVTIKMTALFLLVPMAITGLSLLFTRKTLSTWSWRAPLVTVFLGTVPLLFWIGYGLTTHPVPSLHSFDFLLSSTPTDEAHKLRSELYTFSVESKCESTGTTEDFARFQTNRSLIEHWVMLPWDLTMNIVAGSFATEIGFFFLALLPFWILLRKKFEAKERTKWYLQPSGLLFLFTLGYFALWIWLGQGVIWYGYPGLALLVLLVATLDDTLRPFRLLHSFFWIALIFGLTANTVIQMKLKAERAQVLYAGGELAVTQFLDQSIAGYSGALDILNQNPTSRIILTSSQLWYGITNNDRRATMDSYLDTFNCLHRERDDALTLSRFRELNIRYVLHARSYIAELETGKRPSFNAKIHAFTDFLGKNLRVVWGSPYYTIFEVPATTPNPMY